MKINYVCRNIGLSPDTMGVIEKKMKKLDKYFDDDTQAQVKLTSTGYNTVLIESTIYLKGTPIRVRAEDSDIRTGIEGVVAKFERQISKHKNALRRRLRDNAFGTLPEEPDDEEENGVLVRIKHFSDKPMSVEEAMTQIDLVGHGFFAFVNADSGKVNVLYRRFDGDFGLLIPGEN